MTRHQRVGGSMLKCHPSVIKGWVGQKMAKISVTWYVHAPLPGVNCMLGYFFQYLFNRCSFLKLLLEVQSTSRNANYYLIRFFYTPSKLSLLNHVYFISLNSNILIRISHSSKYFRTFIRIKINIHPKCL